jgi:hypothetical protein
VTGWLGYQDPPAVQPMVELVVRDDRQYAEVVQRWVGGVRTLVPNLWRRLEGTPWLAAVEGEWAPEDRLGPPGGAYATLAVIRRPFSRASVRVHQYSEARWDWLVGELAGRPVSVAADLSELDQAGCDADAGLHLIAATDDDEPDRVRLTALSIVDDPDGDPENPAYLQRWVDLIAEVGAIAEPVFGYLGGEPSVGQTELDRALRRPTQDSVAQGRELLRGFSWLTLVPAALARRLGGVAGLRGSGAFVRVTGLPGGAVLLVATDTLPQYDEAATHRVYTALAPVLPPDVPAELRGRPPA